MKTKIAIQGIESSFHHVAATKLMGNEMIDLIPCDSFEKVVEAVNNNKADYGVLAIENTIAGAILPNYNLIDSAKMVILDEVYLTIQMHLMALESESIHDIKEVHSHPVALLQCKKYLCKFPPQFKVIEGKDTAYEARKIKMKQLRGVAAIAGKQVASKYGLKILDSNIQHVKNNETRFVLLGKTSNEHVSIVNKATLKFELKHEVGSLSNILQVFSTFNISLTKIQSLPILDRPWQYAFFVDIVFQDYQLFVSVVEVLEKVVKQLTVLGVYRENKKNYKSELITSVGKVHLASNYKEKELGNGK